MLLSVLQAGGRFKGKPNPRKKKYIYFLAYPSLDAVGAFTFAVGAFLLFFQDKNIFSEYKR